MKSSLFRRLMMTTILAGGMLSGIAQAQDNGKALDKAYAMDLIKREAVNKTLLEEARRHPGEIFKAAATAYSSQLKGLEKDIDKKMGGYLNKRRVAIIDPSLAAAMRALDLDAVATVNYALSKKGVTSLPDGYEPETIAFAYTGYGLAPSPRPATFSSLFNNESESIVIVPSSAVLANAEHRIDGLTVAENIEFINRHEAWHAIDTSFLFSGIDTTGFHAIDFGDAWQVTPSKNAVDWQIRLHKNEMFSDVAAAGDMIRRGMAPEKIESIIAFREKKPFIAHFSVFGLRLLGETIEKTGLGAFRALDDASFYKLCAHIAEKSALQAEGYKVLAYYDAVSDEKRAFWAKEAETDSAMALTLAYKDRFNALAQNQGPENFTAAGGRRQAAAELDSLGWDPLQEMKDLAFKTDGRITPLTITRAYAALQSGLQAEAAKADGIDADRLIARMEKLETVYIHNVRWIDYVVTNAAYGITPKETAQLKL